MVAPCRGFQSAEATLGEYMNQVLLVVIFAISEAELSSSDENELREIKEKFSLPIFFFKVPESGVDLISPKTPDNEKSSLYCQLMDLEYLSSNHCSCGVPGPDAAAQSMLVEQFEKLRLLSTFSRQVLQKHLVEAATSLNEVHCRCLNIFINQAFDMQRDLQITPKRLEYTRKKENELYESLMNIANRKQEEMKDMIIETLSNMKEELLEDAANMEFKGNYWQERNGNAKSWFLTNQTGFPPEFAAQFWVRVFYFSASISYPAEEEKDAHNFASVDALRLRNKSVPRKKSYLSFSGEGLICAFWLFSLSERFA